LCYVRFSYQQLPDVWQRAEGVREMTFAFATCDVRMAMRFIKHFYPSIDKERIPKLTELIRTDVLRVMDPQWHDPCQIIHGDAYDSKHDSEISAAIQELKKAIEEG